MHLLYFKTSYVIVYRNVGNWLGCAKKYFKTSYVIVYHVPSTLSSDCSLYFKTSYVIVYLPCDIWHCGVFKISKHLMLLFINFNCGKSDKQNYLKTSYVIVYLKEVDRSQKRYIDFKTSHVIVYQAQKAL